MNVFEINKYPPSLFKHGRYLREDWTSCSDIGSLLSDGLLLTRERYLAIELKYVEAILTCMASAHITSVAVHGLEFWNSSNEILSNIGLDDVLKIPVPTEGESLSGSRLQSVIRACLRESAWMELVSDESFLVHFGYDLRLVVGIECMADTLPQTIRNLGLFVYLENRRIETLERWRSLRSPEQ